MLSNLNSIIMAAGFMTLGSSVFAEVCDYRPTKIFGGAGSTVVGGLGGSAAATGAALKTAGFYTLTHAATGATMLASTAGGASAAGTVGIMGGTAGLLGGTVAVLTAPITITIGAGTALIVGGYEGICYFSDERITDYGAVMKIMRNMNEHADPNFFRLVNQYSPSKSYIEIKIDGNKQQYKVEDLYIVEGVLMHRDWFLNTEIGNIGFIAVNPCAEKGCVFPAEQ